MEKEKGVFPLLPINIHLVWRNFHAVKNIFDGSASRSVRKCCSQPVWAVAVSKLDQINRVVDVSELQVPPGNRLERLNGDRANQYSIRITQQYRICFIWGEGHAFEVEITDYH